MSDQHGSWLDNGQRVVDYQSASWGREAGERSSSAALHDHSTSFPSQHNHEITLNFRHVDKRPLQRLVRRRRGGTVQVIANRDMAGAQNREGDAEPWTPSPEVRVGEVRGKPVLAMPIAPSAPGRVREQHRSSREYVREPRRNPPFCLGRGAANVQAHLRPTTTTTRSTTRYK